MDLSVARKQIRKGHLRSIASQQAGERAVRIKSTDGLLLAQWTRENMPQKSNPLDNNYGDRLIRNPAVGRKNDYGSGAEWAGRLAMMMFTIFATLVLWKINPREWLSWYFESCSANGGKTPDKYYQYRYYLAESAEKSASSNFINVG